MLCNHWCHVRPSGLSSEVISASFVTVRVPENSPLTRYLDILLLLFREIVYVRHSPDSSSCFWLFNPAKDRRCVSDDR